MRTRIVRLLIDPRPPIWASTAVWLLLAVGGLLAVHGHEASGTQGHNIPIYVNGDTIAIGLANIDTYQEYWVTSLLVSYRLRHWGQWREVRAVATVSQVFDAQHKPVAVGTLQQQMQRDARATEVLINDDASFGPFHKVPVDLGPLLTESLSRGSAPVRQITLLGALLKSMQVVLIAIIAACPIVALIRVGHLLRCTRVVRRLTKGLCPSCSYELDADDIPCPECGRDYREMRRVALQRLEPRRHPA